MVVFRVHSPIIDALDLSGHWIFSCVYLRYMHCVCTTVIECSVIKMQLRIHVHTVCTSVPLCNGRPVHSKYLVETE